MRRKTVGSLAPRFKEVLSGEHGLSLLSRRSQDFSSPRLIYLGPSPSPRPAFRFAAFGWGRLT